LAVETLKPQTHKQQNIKNKKSLKNRENIEITINQLLINI